MCNISGFWFRETIDISYLKTLLAFGRLRGTDGVGIAKVDLNELNCVQIRKNQDIEKTNEIIDELHNSSYITNKRNILYLSNHRAAPETEKEVDDEEKTLQPIYNKIKNQFGLLLVHNGSVSNFVVEEMKKDVNYKCVSNLDSEAIIWAYSRLNFNMKETMSFLSGGFSFILYDAFKKRIYVVCTHNPLFCGYVCGAGMFWSSSKEAIWSTISKIKGFQVHKNNIAVREDYYCREISSYTIEEIDVDSGCINEFKFEPRYIHPKWDPYVLINKNKTKKALVACSGGLDSTTTLSVLKASGFDCTAVHFKYGHRGEECELSAIKNITSHLDVPLLIFEIPIIKELDKGILTDEKASIETGTVKNTKTTYAWTTFRNHLFEAHLGCIAESLILEYNYERVYIAGGHLQLSESGSYPDNSERFAKACEDFFRFSITGTRINHLFTLCNLLKWEQFVLLDRLDLTYLMHFLISCDRPKLINGIPRNCQFFNQKTNQYEPACGSGRRSWYSLKIANITDLYRYYTIDDKSARKYVPYEMPRVNSKNYDLSKIVDKIMIPEENKRILIDKLEL